MRVFIVYRQRGYHFSRLTIPARPRFTFMRKLLLLLALLAVTASAADRSRFSYIYKEGEHTHIRNSAMDIEQIVRMSKRWQGNYVWLRLDGKSWLIRDAAVLAEVRGAFAEMHALEPTMRAAAAQRSQYEDRMEPLEKKLDRLRDRDEDEGERDEKQIRELERRLEAIEREYESVERRADALEEKMDRLE